MGWMQRLLGENEAGHGNAFSVFVGCQRCESHKPVMAAVAEIKWWVNGMHIRVFFGPGLLAKEIRPRARCFRNPTHVKIITWIGMCAAQLPWKPSLAVAAGSCWLQLRLAWVRGSAGSVRSVSKLVPSVQGLRAANTSRDLPGLLQKS